MKRLLLVSHRPIDQAGGPAARWRSFAKHLPTLGWEVDVVSGRGGDEFASPARAQARARPWRRSAGSPPRRFAPPAAARGDASFDSVGAARGGRGAPPASGPALRRRPRDRAALAGLIAARMGHGDVPLVVELRDLWAGNPAFDRGGPILRRLESWVVKDAAAVIAVTPEAADDLRRRHPGARIEEIANGFEPELLEKRRPSSGTTIIHSGTLTKDRPLAPLLRALRPPLRSSCTATSHRRSWPRSRCPAPTSRSSRRQAGKTRSTESPRPMSR